MTGELIRRTPPSEVRRRYTANQTVPVHVVSCCQRPRLFDMQALIGGLGLCDLERLSSGVLKPARPGIVLED